MMTNIDDAAVEALLRKHFEGPVPAGRFCDRVMAQLPRHPRRRVWPLAAGVLAGAAACWLSLVAAPLVHIGWRDWLSGVPSAPAIALLLVTAGIPLLAMGWAAAEMNDR